MATREQFRATLFREGERSLQAVSTEAIGYRCPVCWKEFDEEGSFTIDHVPQKAWAAQVRVLTCRSCNSTFGHRYQPALSRLQDLAELRAGKAKNFRAAAVSIDGRKFNARVRNVGGLLWIHGSKKNNPPEVAEYWLGRRDAQIRAEAVRLLIPGKFDQEKIERVLLRDAFLLAFHHLGYPYISTPAAQSLRQLLHEEEPIPLGTLWDLPSLPLDVNPASGEFIWVQEPEELAALLIRFDVPLIGRRFVLLPFFLGLSRSYQELCAAWYDASMGGDLVEMSLIKAIAHPDARFSARLVSEPVSDTEVVLMPYDSSQSDN